MIRVHSLGDVDDYLIDWSVELSPGDTIAGSTMLPGYRGVNGLWVTDVTTITVASNTFTTTTATVIGVGTTINTVPGTTYAILNHITTTQGRQQDQTLYLYIAGR